ncbi:MAG: hypothetical protein ACE5IY_18650 [bacterium]
MPEKKEPQGEMKNNTESKKAKAEQAKSESQQTDSATLLDKVSDVAQKGVEALKTGVDKVGQAAEDTAKLAKLKLGMHKLSKEQNNLHVKAGTKIWTLKKAQKADDLDKQLSDEIRQYHKLQKQITEIKQEIEQ